MRYPTTAVIGLLMGVTAAEAAVLRVGRAGDHPTIQSAVDVAIVTPEADELRIHTGTYVENVAISTGDLGGGLAISGGWHDDYATRTLDPTATVIDGASAGRAFFAAFQGDDLVLDGLTFRNGRTDLHGAGARIDSADSRVRIERCRFVDNVAVGIHLGAGAAGGGLLATAGPGSLVVVDSVFDGNHAGVDGGFWEARGGGALLGVNDDDVTLVVRRAVFANNAISGGSQRYGAGLVLGSSALHADMVVEDTVFSGNYGIGSVSGSALYADLSGDDVDLVVRRVAAVDNRAGPDDESAQIWIHTEPNASVRISDSLAARGGTGFYGLVALGELRLVNVTATGNNLYGIDVEAESGGASVSNAIAWNNGAGDVRLVGGVASESNLVGVDPGFVDAATGDYRLAARSPAIGGGTTTPLGGLSLLDLDHAPRTVGDAPDQGAYERGGIFADGFESGDPSSW